MMPMLREVEHLDPGPIERARATWIEEVETSDSGCIYLTGRIGTHL